MTRLVLCSGKTAHYALYIDGKRVRQNEFARHLMPHELEQYRTNAFAFLKTLREQAARSEAQA